MDYSAWTVDLKTLSATHSCGFRIEIEGSPKNPNAVHPGKFPAGLTSIDQVRLVRTGVEALAEEAKKGVGSRPVAPKPAYTPPANKPKRATLSLKKRSKSAPEEA
ncbi:hypothetical protein [Pseudomaricurvus alkylphenolicus]|jgi:hypothetical protein|uniref:hypothetical protein n=1 Tax=Pseudomaricurvus alkylphenolicus TaxID=1306991 RepID=UPI00197F36C7|nr:hypothetical protein [Pseudomaricurvus alkylphenolicus]